MFHIQLSGPLSVLWQSGPVDKVLGSHLEDLSSKHHLYHWPAGVTLTKPIYLPLPLFSLSVLPIEIVRSGGIGRLLLCLYNT